MKYEVRFTTQFKKDLKLAKKQNRDIDLLFEVIDKLANDEVLDAKFRDHNLTGNYVNFRECHVESDWLLIYKKEEDILVLLLQRIGSHSELF
ncbi:MAG: type II toxin-antitoxin system YafQ family toxin [Oscillospiraceae bacterium]|nr:type II toxin-antitoxin system YafQ family toxin [Ruminococcus sp.]MCD8345092.1 type II toxin-antitoxin system YafQ family toxin [Oscillospiraceae bacterium]